MLASLRSSAAALSPGALMQDSYPAVSSAMGPLAGPLSDARPPALPNGRSLSLPTSGLLGGLPLFNPFGENPLHKALQATERLEQAPGSGPAALASPLRSETGAGSPEAGTANPSTGMASSSYTAG